MNNPLDLTRLYNVATMLDNHLPAPEDTEAPAEIVRALAIAREQMGNIPAVLDDLQAARREFAVLDRAIDRLVEIARLSAGMSDEDDRGREGLEAEFLELAGVVARAAGRQAYRGPRLSVAGKARAEASVKALRLLAPVKSGLAERLDEQETLIIQAIGATINLIEAVAGEFPEIVSPTETSDLLKRVGWVREVCEPAYEVSRATDIGLH